MASWSKHNVFTAMTKAYEIGLYSDKQKSPEARRLSVKAETVLLLRAGAMLVFFELEGEGIEKGVR